MACMTIGLKLNKKIIIGHRQTTTKQKNNNIGTGRGPCLMMLGSQAILYGSGRYSCLEILKGKLNEQHAPAGIFRLEI